MERPLGTRSRRAAGIVWGLLVVVGGAACACRRADGETAVESSATAEPVAVETPLTWRAGADYGYELELASELTLAGSPFTRLSLRGELAVSFFESDAAPADHAPGRERLSGLARVRRLQFSQSAEDEKKELDALAAELERGFLFQLERGRVVELRLRRAAPALAISIARTLSSALQLAARPGQSPLWSGEEVDASGTYVAEYRSSETEGRFSKRKLRYLPSKVPAPAKIHVSLDLAPEVVSSKGSLELRDSALGSLEYEEVLRTRLAGDRGAETATRFTLKRRATPSERPRTSYAALRAETEEAGILLSQQTTKREQHLDAVKRGNFTLESALSALKTLEARLDATRVLDAPSGANDAAPPSTSAHKEAIADHNRVFTALAAILATDPGAARRAETRIRQGDGQRKVLIEALAAADSDGAERVLLNVARDRSLPDDSRHLAAFSLIRLANPSDASVTGLTALSSDPLLSTYAIYGLGTFARRLREQGRSELARRSGDVLIEGLKRARTETDRVHYLRGIANSGDARAFAAVVPLVDSPDESMGAAAIEALRLMDLPEVDTLIARRLSAERRPFVLYAALNAAKTRQATADVARALERVAKEGPDLQGRLRAVELLVRWLPAHPELAATLRFIAENDAAPAARAAAEAGLKG